MMSHHSLEFIAPASLWEPKQIVTSAWLEHAPFAFWLIQAVRPRVFVELGTHFGFSYLAFCQAVQTLNLSTRCFAVDTWTGDDHAGFYVNEVFEQLKIKNEESYSNFSRLLRMHFDEALSCFSDGEVDLLHIDGRHGYEDVHEDFTTWLPKMSNHGVVLFHDINVREREFGVWRLWREIAAQFPSFEFIHGHGLGVLGVGRDLPVAIQALFACDGNTASEVRRSYSQLGRHITQRAVLEATHSQMVAHANEADQLRGRVAALEARADDEAHQATVQSARAAELEQQLALSGAELHHCAADAQDRTAQLEARCVDLEIRIATCESSTIWRVTKPLRTILSSMSPGIRLMLRRAVKSAFWLVTPHRMPARIRFLTQRRKSMNNEQRTQPLPGQMLGVPVLQPGWFDPEWYLQEYPDVAAAGIDPYAHFVQYGWRERRNPHPLFDMNWYLEHNPEPVGQQTMPPTYFLEKFDRRPMVPFDRPARKWMLSETTYGDVPSSLPILYMPPSRAPCPEFSLAEFNTQLDTVEVVSFDIFDTALYRRTVHPITVFELLGERFDHVLSNTRYKYADIRFWAEREARKRGLAEKGSQEIDLGAIYDVASESLEIGKHGAKSLMLAELDEERKVLAVNPTALAMANAALAKGKRVIFVSDMYLPSDFLREILMREGFPSVDIFVSCEHSAGKWEGKLFTIVATACGVDGSRILHVGDNFNSDKLQAERAGWRAMQYLDPGIVQPYALQLANTSSLLIGNITTSVSLGLAHVHRAHIEASQLDWCNRFASHVGYEVLGPTVLGFASWVAQQVKELKLDRVLFLARDGYLPSMAYERLRVLDSSLCRSCYVAASRRLLYCTSLETENDIIKAAERIFFVKDTTLEEYLDIFWLTYEEVKVHANHLGFGDGQLPIAANMDLAREYSSIHQRLITLVRHFASLVLSRAKEGEELLRAYYEQSAGIERASCVATVDLGWGGSLVQPFKHMLAKVNRTINYKALFFGLNSYADRAIPESIKSYTYFFNRRDAQCASPFVLPSPTCPQDILGASVSLMEMLISANHTTYIGMRRDETTGKVMPITAEESWSPEQREFLQIAHDACMQFVDDALKILPCDTRGWDFRPLIGQTWTRLLSSPNADEAALLGALPHRADASGHVATTTLIEMPGATADRAALWNAFSRSMWPSGWFALLDPVQRGRMLGPAASDINI